jgi:hypothetical protein
VSGLKNSDVFVKNPASYTLPNDGVAKVIEPRTEKEWEVARYELENFVCEGSYHEGLRLILESYLANLSQPTQQAVWVHGFYGCGKSQLVRVIEFLWRDLYFPDGATARGIARIPDDIRDALTELSKAGRLYGGLWSAAGTLGAGVSAEPRAAMLGIILRSAGLPERIHEAQFDMWLRQEEIHDLIRAGLEQRGRKYEDELKHLLVSTALAEELIRVRPALASSPGQTLELIKGQFPEKPVTTEVMVDMMRNVFRLKSTKSDTSPCVLVVIDELQQYLGHSVEKADAVQEAVQAAVSRFESRLLFVATGQSALQSDHVLQKLQSRFTIHIALEDKDTETVLRQTVLRKKPSAEPDVSSTIDRVRGEIDRHLGGTQIGVQTTDVETLVADYPLLPTRRRFWQRVLRGLDRTGTTAQLRTQLRLAHEAAREVADKPLGVVPGGDFVFDQQKPTLLQTSVLLRDTNEIITRLHAQGTEDGELAARICALLFLIGEVDPHVGLLTTPDTLADLLVNDITAGSSRLRQEIPRLLNKMLDEGIVMQDGDEYRIQTREGAEWDRDYRTRASAIRSDDVRISTERERRLREAIQGLFTKSMTITQGVSRVPRHIQLHFGPDMPKVESKISIWVRSGWDVNEKRFCEDAYEAGAESPVVFVFMPRLDHEDLKEHIAARLACQEVLDTRPTPTEDTGKAAKKNIEARLERHNSAIGDIISRIANSTVVFQGGGTQVEGDTLGQIMDQAIRSSLSRLFPRFHEADSLNWARVCEKARFGNTSALVDVGHKSYASQHPVCKEVLAFVGFSGKSGNEVRRKLEEPPLGWPRDAIDSALVVLTLSGHLHATYKAKSIGASDLTGTIIQQTEFREEERVIAREEKMEVRKLLQQCGVGFKPGEESKAVHTLLEKLRLRAQEAGGDPPLPEQPSSQYIDDITNLSGNALLAAVHEERLRLGDHFRQWGEASKKASIRLYDWKMLLAFLEHSRKLREFDSLHAEKEAIIDQRSLLADPNPVAPLLSAVTTALRAALQSARKEHLDAYEKRIVELVENPMWAKLLPDKQEEIRRRHSLGPLLVPKLDTNEDLLRELNETPLSSWADKTAAVAERIAQVLLDVAKECEPKAERLMLPRATIRNEEELDKYLESAKQKALSLMKSGKLVVLP